VRIICITVTFKRKNKKIWQLIKVIFLTAKLYILNSTAVVLNHFRTATQILPQKSIATHMVLHLHDKKD